MPKLKNDTEHSIEIKKSRFITYLHRTDSEEEAKEFLRLVKKEHPDASHHCTAMIIGNTVRSSDDGEPAGTAGHPMLDVLAGSHMEDILAVVVRYFGGTLLGKGGLVRAYSSSVQEALQNAQLVEIRTLMRWRIVFDYSAIGRIDQFFRASRIEVLSRQYESDVIYEFCSRENMEAELNELTSGNILIEYLGEFTQESLMPFGG